MPPKPFFMQSIYRPAHGDDHADPELSAALPAQKEPNTGTSTTYMAVRNAALAVDG